jgi:hypothetical protein
MKEGLRIGHPCHGRAFKIGRSKCIYLFIKPLLWLALRLKRSWFVILIKHKSETASGTFRGLQFLELKIKYHFPAMSSWLLTVLDTHTAHPSPPPENAEMSQMTAQVPIQKTYESSFTSMQTRVDELLGRCLSKHKDIPLGISPCSFYP